MEELTYDATGTDAVYLANTGIIFTALFALEIFRNGWPEEKLGSQAVLEKARDWYREMFQGGLTGNRMHIAARKAARLDLDARIRKILHYLVVMADESEIAALINTGVVKYKLRKRVRKPAKTVAN